MLIVTALGALDSECAHTVRRSPSSYSGKVFRVVLVSLAVFLLFPLLVVCLILESPIQPDVLR